MRRVVITGLGVVSPIGSGREAFYTGLRNATPGIDTITHFDASAFPSRIAGEIRDLDITQLELPREVAGAVRRDPKALYGLVAGREALANANLAAAYAPERVGLSMAAGLEIFHLLDLLPHLGAQGIDAATLFHQLESADVGAYLQIPADLAARALAVEANAQGAFCLNVSACAAGTQAIGEAFHAIRDGALDAALTGGYDSMVNPLGVAGFTLLEALSTQNELRGAASRPFDARRDGFVLGEGAAALVLEEREAALARGAVILAELCGYASTLDAFRVTDPAPDRAGARAAMRRALDDASLQPEQIDYINAHGTATRKNDPGETAAIRGVFGEHASHLAISSTKGQIGHLIGAAGAVEAVASLFALHEQLLPATINLEQPDPECDLDYVPLSPRAARVRHVLSNSFGFGGQNAALIFAAAEQEA